MFDDYTSKTKDFSKNNLIFGWNYSGKTTLSRIFRSLETGQHHPNFADSSFLIELDDGTKISSNDIAEHDLRVKVFNSDYVKLNLKWEEREGGLPPIFGVGEEAIELQNEIDDLKKEHRNLVKEKEALNQQKSRAKKDLENEMTQKAAKISRELRLAGRFNRASLRRYLEDQNIASWELDKEKYGNKRSTIHQSEKMNDVPVINLNAKENIYNNTVNLLKEVVTPSKTLERLRSESKIERWVSQGIELHRNREICSFCGSLLTSSILDELDAHFSKDYNEFVERIEDHINHQLPGASLSVKFSPVLALYPEFQDEYEITRGSLEKLLAKYNDFIEKLTKKTKNKLTNPTAPARLDDIEDFQMTEIEKAVEDINSIIQKHNKKNLMFEQIQTEAIDALKKHEAAVFYRERKYLQRSEQIEKQNEEVEKINSDLKLNDQKQIQLRAKISDIAKGAEELEKYMDEYFGGNSPLYIKVTEDDRFQLMRGDVAAKNLSEGEKTAIAFSYFLAELHDRDNKGNIKKSIIFIDDPISSLDTNHLYNTYSLINVYLKGICAQLFVSTHNHEFFKLMKDEFKPGRRKKLKCEFNQKGQQSNKECGSPLYQVSRKGETSALEDVDCLLCYFNSEFYYIFKELY